MTCRVSQLTPGAHLGFLVGWAPTLQGAPTHHFAKFCKKNCMKLRETLAVGGAPNLPMCSSIERGAIQGQAKSGLGD